MRYSLTCLKYAIFLVIDLKTQYALAKTVKKEDTLYPVHFPMRVQSIHMDKQMGCSCMPFPYCRPVFPARYCSCFPRLL